MLLHLCHVLSSVRWFLSVDCLPPPPLDRHRYMDKKLQLKLNAGRVVTGVLRGFDPYMNLVVHEAVEETKERKNHIGTVVSATDTTSGRAYMYRLNSASFWVAGYSRGDIVLVSSPAHFQTPFCWLVTWSDVFSRKVWHCQTARRLANHIARKGNVTITK